MPYRAQWTGKRGKRLSLESVCPASILDNAGDDAAYFRHDPRFGRDALNSDKWLSVPRDNLERDAMLMEKTAA